MILFLKSVLRVIVIFTGATNLNGGKKATWYNFFSVIIVSILCFGAYLIDPQLEGIVIVPFTAVFIFIKNRKILKSLLLSFGAILLVVLSEFLTKLIISITFDLEDSVFALGDDNFLVFLGMTIGILFFVYIFTKGIYLAFNKNNKLNHRMKLFELLAIFLSFVVFVVILAGIKVIRIKDDFFSFSIYFVCYIALAITLITLYRVAKKDMMIKLKAEEQENLKHYTQELEVLCDELHRIMHENNNIMLTMAHYIETKNMPQLEKYFNDKIMAYKKRHVIDEKNLLALSNITQPELKSLIYCKLIEANEKSLNPVLDVHQDLSITEADTIDLSSMIGILIDNAIQGAEKCEIPELKIGLIAKDKSKLIVVQNSCPLDMPPLQQLFSGQASTKNKTGSSHGLTNLQQIIEKYPNFYLNTEIDNSIITQCIVIDE